MIDKEIIKALECCIKAKTNADCEALKCPFYDNEIDICMYVNNEEVLYANALDLINRQQATIERLTINMNAFGLGMKREKERADTIRAEAIKEFWEKLWELDPEIISKVVSFDLDELNNLIKETVGEENDNR